MYLVCKLSLLIWNIWAFSCSIQFISNPTYCHYLPLNTWYIFITDIIIYLWIVHYYFFCGESQVASISEDLEKGPLASAVSLPKPGREGLIQILDNRNVKVIPFSAWEKIDAEERRRGELNNKPREKLTTWEELLEVASEWSRFRAWGNIPELVWSNSFCIPWSYSVVIWQGWELI